MEPMMNAMMPQSGAPAPIQRPSQMITPTRPEPQMEGQAGMSPQMQMILALLMAVLQGGQGMGQPPAPAPMPAPAGPPMPPMGGM